MSAIQAVSGAAGVAVGAGAGGAAKSSSQDNQDRFLKLLVTQLKNQDPLNPLDNAQMTTQMAQISSLQGIEQLNKTLEALVASFSGGQTVQAAALVGREVMAPGSDMVLSAGHAQAGVELPQAVDQLTVTILDAAGAVVHRAELGAHAQGVVKIDWDGITDNGTSAAEGRYQIKVTGLANGKDVGAQALMSGRVMGVSSSGSATTLDLGSLGKVGLDQVRQYL
ncbi:MAG: flagellar hook assembly protein FlgD [Betaproteobacteria bacterium]|nr:flagellar hook assembly protein FlgD [Betaproteobacteria bacterium]